MKIHTIRIATGNPNKVSEIQTMLGSSMKVKDLTGLSGLGEIQEDALTFTGNADIKALAVSQLCQDFVLADDSGLCVNGLNGAPGVRSARYAGEEASMEQNKKLLLENLKGQKGEAREAYFICALSVAYRGEIVARFEGKSHGRIITEECGEEGFGYDPMFVPEGLDRTFAQISAAEKNKISHRARAMQSFCSWLEEQNNA